MVHTLPTLEMLSERIGLLTCSSIEIAGLLKKRKNNNYDDEMIR